MSADRPVRQRKSIKGLCIHAQGLSTVDGRCLDTGQGVRPYRSRGTTELTQQMPVVGLGGFLMVVCLQRASSNDRWKTAECQLVCNSFLIVHHNVTGAGSL